MLEPGRNCWRIERADRAALIVDAADYFRLARLAMLAARSQILMIGWDFDTRINLVPEAGDRAPSQLGAFVSWLPKQSPGLQIHILKWDIGAIKLLGRGTTMFRLARWAVSRDIHFKLDGAHAVGASHHQKILVIDDRLAFCGGIDMTAARWDTREHRHRDHRRQRPTTHRRYDPWHDATMAVDGAAARALGELARDRWQAAGGKPIAPPQAKTMPWPAELEPHFSQVDVAISRTRGGYNDVGQIREIEALFVDQIRRARKLVYAENQYFASRKIAAAIIERLEQADCPEIIIVNPKSGEGLLDEEAMTPARAELLDVVRRADRFDRFRMFTPVTDGGEDIYVHSKILIVDDRLLRVGSANFNNRSMGLDSECDLTIDTEMKANQSCGPIITALLYDLLAEHLGVSADVFRKVAEAAGSYIVAVEQLCGGDRSLVPLRTERPSQLEERLAKGEVLDPESGGEEFEPVARPGLLQGLRARRKPRA